MQDKDILNQMENNSNNSIGEQIPGTPPSKFTEENLESTIRDPLEVELVKSHTENSDVESKTEKSEKVEKVEKDEFNFLFDGDGDNYHSSLKNDDDNSPSSETLELNFGISSICHNKEKDTGLLSRKRAKKESNDSEN